MVASLTPMLSLSRPKLVTNWKSDVFLNDTDPLDRDLPHHCHTVEPHCFDADPDPDPAQNLDPDPGRGGRSAKNVHPPWQNPRYAPV